MTNIDLAAKVLKGLIASGIHEFCLCAGARNSPFVHILDENKQIKVYSFFEERSASFFALGRMARTQRPMAVITTSGTAVAELLPAVVEATYSSLPLVMVTADRPKTFRGSGAPQSIEQVGVFSYYIEASLDIDNENNHFSVKGLTWKKPFHINVCFDEPLIDDVIPQLQVPETSEWVKFPEQPDPDAATEITQFLKSHKPIVLLGILPPKAQRPVLDFLKKVQLPVYAEGISGLRGHPEIKHLEIRSGENYLNHLLDTNLCDSIFRIGGVPTVRLWRDLEKKRAQLPVMSIGFNHYTGLSRGVKHFTHLAALASVESSGAVKDLGPLLTEDLRLDLKKEEILKKYPLSEPSMVWSLSKKLKDQSVYLGNSLPIRHWDLVADFDSYPARVVGNRGANGIDGQVSTFLGWSETGTENWCLVGDLTALYDLASLWITPQLEEKGLRIVVINNKGGQIFSRMFQRDIFINRHNIEFHHWAQMFRWEYSAWTEVPENSELSMHHLIELIPDSQQTDDFWKEWDAMWKK